MAVQPRSLNESACQFQMSQKKLKVSISLDLKGSCAQPLTKHCVLRSLISAWQTLGFGMGLDPTEPRVPRKQEAWIPKRKSRVGC